MLSDSEFQAVATVKVGPVKTRWKGKVRLSDFDPPNSYRISGEGDGGVAGFAKGAAKVSLADKDGGTLFSYNVSHKSVESSPSSASASSTARQRRPPTISSKNSEPPSATTSPPRRHKPSTWRPSTQ